VSIRPKGDVARGADESRVLATAAYPQYSQIESKQVIFANASIKRACLRIFTRCCANNAPYGYSVFPPRDPARSAPSFPFRARDSADDVTFGRHRLPVAFGRRAINPAGRETRRSSSHARAHNHRHRFSELVNGATKQPAGTDVRHCNAAAIKRPGWMRVAPPPPK